MPFEDHQVDDEGQHDEEDCELCLERNGAVGNSCRCGNCCQGLIIEASLRDAQREPRIAERCSPMYDDLRGERVLIGYLLNSRESPCGCTFLDRETRLCTIYPTRPLCCRLFDCAAYEDRDPNAIPSPPGPHQESA